MKDLGKGLGMYVIVVNCSEGLDYKSMGRMFSGLAQVGSELQLLINFSLLLERKVQYTMIVGPYILLTIQSNCQKENHL